MKITNGKDFWAGLMFVGAGLGFMIVASPPKPLVDLLVANFRVQPWGYPMGNAVRMGPAYFPTMLGGILAALGAIVFFRSFVSKVANPLRAFPFRPWVFAAGVVLAVIAYFSMGMRDGGTALRYAHMALSGAALVTLFAAFGPKALWVILASTLVFGYMLKPLGLVLAIGILIIGSALGGHEFKWKEVIFLFIGLAIFSVAAFVHGLQLPMNVWPAFLE